MDDPTRRRMITHLEHEVAQFLGALAEFTAVDGRGVLDLIPLIRCGSGEPHSLRSFSCTRDCSMTSSARNRRNPTTSGPATSSTTGRPRVLSTAFLRRHRAASRCDQCINKQLARDQTVYGRHSTVAAVRLMGQRQCGSRISGDKRQSIGPHHSPLRWRPDCCGYFRCHMPPRRPPPWPPSRNGMLP